MSGFDRPLEEIEAGHEAWEDRMLKEERERKDAARWRHFRGMSCGRQRWLCACAENAKGAESMDALVDEAMTPPAKGVEP